MLLRSLFQFRHANLEGNYLKNNNNRFFKTINTASEVSIDHVGDHDQSIQCNASRCSGITDVGRPT